MGHDRRSFLKFILGAGAGITASPVIFKTLDDASIWTQNWSWIPRNPKGENSYELTTSKLSPAAEGLKVRLVAGQPVRALPDSGHPLGGGLSALAAAEVQLMYSPARVKAPLRRSADGTYVRIEWEEALALLANKLGEAGNSVAAISGDENGSSMEVLSAFLSGRGSDELYMIPSEAQAASRAWQLMGGKGQIGYDLENSDFILAIGANVLESWGCFIKNRRDFSAKRPHGAAPENTLVYAGPVQNNTAAVADQWVCTAPGSEVALALGIAAQLAQQGRSINSPNASAFRAMLTEFTPAKVQGFTGVSPEVLQGLVAGLLKARNPVVIVGSAFGQGGGAAPVMAGIALNLMLGGSSVKDVPLAAPVVSWAKGRNAIFQKDLVSYLSAAPKAKAMIFYEANPVYALPAPKKVAEAIKAVPFKVSFSAFMDETAALCDLVLPMPLGLERLDDVETPYGSAKVFYGISRKTMESETKARHGMDVLMAISAKLGKNIGSNFEAVLKAKAAAVGADWARVSAGTAYSSNRTNALGQISLDPRLISQAVDRKSAGAAVRLAPMQKIALGTAQTGIPPFNLKTIKGGELIGEEMCVMMNSDTATSRNGLRNGDRVILSAAGNEIGARVLIYEGIATDVVGVYLGFGHTALDEFSQNKGANVAELFAATVEPGTGLSVWNQTGVTIVKA